MKPLKIRIIILLLLIAAVYSCKQKKQDGILIGNDLYISQSYQKNAELRNLIKQTLDKNPEALVELKNFWCGGGAGCYSLGFIITQIIYKIGEQEFLTLLEQINSKDRKGIEGFIRAGLEYGDNDGDGKSDNKRIEKEFPSIYKLLNESKINF